MSHPRRPSLIVLALAGALLGPTAASAASGCGVKGSTVLAQNQVVRAYSTSGGDLYACLKRTGRKVLLLSAERDLYYLGSFAQVKVAGRFVGFYAEVTDTSCKADCPPTFDATTETVRVADVRNRTARAIAAIPAELAVNGRGMLAWTQATELHLSRSGEQDDVVASGDVDLEAFSGRYLLWRAAGETRWLDATT